MKIPRPKFLPQNLHRHTASCHVPGLCLSVPVLRRLAADRLGQLGAFLGVDLCYRFPDCALHPATHPDLWPMVNCWLVYVGPHLSMVMMFMDFTLVQMMQTYEGCF